MTQSRSVLFSVISDADDMESLLYQFLEEFLFIFTTELLVFKEVKIIEFDRQQWRIKARWYFVIERSISTLT